MCPRIFPNHEAARLTFPHTELVINGPILHQTTELPELAGSDIADAAARGNAGPKLPAQNKRLEWQGDVRLV